MPTLGRDGDGACRPRHIRDLCWSCARATCMAPGASACLRDGAACSDGHRRRLIPYTPCVLAKGSSRRTSTRILVPRERDLHARGIDADHRVRILEDRRVVHALKALAGLRYSEPRPSLAAVRHDLEPLGALNLEKTKTQVPRRVPVHRRSPASCATGAKAAGSEPTVARRPTTTSSSRRAT